ncbi:uncharacterized protein [Amphiura filiformis]|uniref:uncharacterized protein n=1 Tax=Amphiura filiformis TaxID=82378 RepID=UPI003B21ED6B
MVEDYYREDLDLDDTLMIQQFLELCLSCNYEADHKERFTGLLGDVFLRGMVYFLGISSSTALALGYYMEHSQPGDIKSLKLRPIVHPGDNINPTGPLDKLYTQYLSGINQIPASKMQEIGQEFFSRYQGSVDTDIEAFKKEAPAATVTLIQMWQRCQDLPTPEETNISPVINALPYTQLEAFDISDFKIRDNIDQFVEACEKGHMSHLQVLKVSNIGMQDYQTERLAQVTSYMADLEELNISINAPGRSLEYLAETLAVVSLNKLNIQSMEAPAEVMDIFTQKLPDFCSQLIGLYMDVNDMNDNVASNLESHLPIAKQLRLLSISVWGLSRERHNQLVLTMGRLTRLQQLYVYESQYPDDLLESVADVMPSLPDLIEVVLGVEITTSPKVSSSSWHHFKSKLQNVVTLKRLQLSRIALERNDFIELIQLCREQGLTSVRYHINCVPDGVAVPEGDIFQFM